MLKVHLDQLLRSPLAGIVRDDWLHTHTEPCIARLWCLGKLHELTYVLCAVGLFWPVAHDSFVNHMLGIPWQNMIKFHRWMGECLVCPCACAAAQQAFTCPVWHAYCRGGHMCTELRAYRETIASPGHLPSEFVIFSRISPRELQYA